MILFMIYDFLILFNRNSSFDNLLQFQNKNAICEA